MQDIGNNQINQVYCIFGTVEENRIWSCIISTAFCGTTSFPYILITDVYS